MGRSAAANGKRPSHGTSPTSSSLRITAHNDPTPVTSDSNSDSALHHHATEISRPTRKRAHPRPSHDSDPVSITATTHQHSQDHHHHTNGDVLQPSTPPMPKRRRRRQSSVVDHSAALDLIPPRRLSLSAPTPMSTPRCEPALLLSDAIETQMDFFTSPVRDVLGNGPLEQPSMLHSGPMEMEEVQVLQTGTVSALFMPNHASDLAVDGDVMPPPTDVKSPNQPSSEPVDIDVNAVEEEKQSDIERADVVRRKEAWEKLKQLQQTYMELIDSFYARKNETLQAYQDTIRSGTLY